MARPKPRPDAVLLLYLRNHIEDKGFAPTVREIAEQFGISISNAHYRLGILVNAGLIERVGARAIKINYPEMFGEQKPIRLYGVTDG